MADALARLLEGVSRNDLARRSAAITARYRAGEGSQHAVRDRLDPERTFRNVEIDLPPMSGGTPKKIPVYRRIYDLVTRFGGRRYAKQILA